MGSKSENFRSKSEIFRFSRFFRFSKLRFSNFFFYPKTHFFYLVPDFFYLLRHFLYPTDNVGIIKTKKYCLHPPKKYKLETLSTPKRPNRAPNPIGPYLDRPLHFGHFSPSPGGPQAPETFFLYLKTHFLYLKTDFLYLLTHFLYPTDNVGIIKNRKNKFLAVKKIRTRKIFENFEIP